ncbi:MAG: DUF938 domain-containing protein [Candidatus Competibacterales bacterium]
MDTPHSADHRLYYPATQRNRDPILGVLKAVLPPQGTVLELAAGSGEHAVYFAPRFPRLQWLPSDPDSRARESIDAWRQSEGVANVAKALALAAEDRPWPANDLAAVVAVNVLHVAPWSTTEGLLAGAARHLIPGGVLYLYGPFAVDGHHTSPGNAEFDASLRRQNPALGLRDTRDVTAKAEDFGLILEASIPMPANNLSLVWRRPPH